MPKLTIDGMEIEVAPGTSVLQAAEQLGIEIPRFCFHDKLSVPANCRMCLVEMEKSPKPIASCAFAAADGMVIKTNSEVTHRARKNVMEMLLINHPLDCPICDQAGECDLQDQAVAYGWDRSRYSETKRAVKDKDFGPLVETHMTRCIQCTRCVRFMDEIAGSPELGLAGRGEDVEIGTYVEKTLTSELQGNIVDVCPVGALTSKPYAFTARPWELRKTESVDVFDAVGSNIRIDVRGNEVLRVLPRLNEDVNEEWLADKSRYAIDGLKVQRLDQPYVRDGGKLRPASWEEAFKVISAKFKGEVAAVAGDMADAESMLLLKELVTSMGGKLLECRQDGGTYDTSVSGGYRFNTTIAGLEKCDALLLIGTNPRYEAPLLNARIRKAWRNSGLKVGVVGPKANLTYPYQYIGAGAASLKDLGSFAEVLKNAKNPALIIGMGAMGAQGLAREIAEKFNMVREDWNGFNVLHTAAARVAGLELGFSNAGGLKAVLDAAKNGAAIYNLGADEIDGREFGGAFVVYQGHHGDKGAERADVILPGAAYTEKTALYLNTEGRCQTTRQATFPPGQAKEDWKILRALSEVLGKTLPYDTQAAVRKKLAEVSPAFAGVDKLVPAKWGKFGVEGEASFLSPVKNYYMTDAISRASATMAKCVSEIWPEVTGATERTGSHG